MIKKIYILFITILLAASTITFLILPFLMMYNTFISRTIPIPSWLLLTVMLTAITTLCLRGAYKHKQLPKRRFKKTYNEQLKEIRDEFAAKDFTVHIDEKKLDKLFNRKTDDSLKNES